MGVHDRASVLELKHITSMKRKEKSGYRISDLRQKQTIRQLEAIVQLLPNASLTVDFSCALVWRLDAPL